MARRKIMYQRTESQALREGLNKQSKWREENDCAVRALATVTGLPYEKIHDMLALCGRKNRQATQTSHQQRVLEKLGYRLEFYHPDALGVKTYISLHKSKLKGNWLVYTKRHVAAYTRCTLHDYFKFLNTRRRVDIMVKVVKPRGGSR